MSLCPDFGSLLSVLKAKVAEMEQTCADEHDHSEAEASAPAEEPAEPAADAAMPAD